MGRAWNRLAANFVRTARERGRYADGGNLHLQVARGGTRAWVFIYQRNGSCRAMGLGSARSVPLALARQLAAQAREQLARGIDPIDARKAAALEQRAARARLMSFQQCAKEYHAANASRWTNEKHRKEWLSTLRRFAFPVIGHLSVGAITSDLIYKVLQPLVGQKAITAARVRGRIETVLDYAKAAGRRTGDNPASKVIIGNMLPMRPEKAHVVHQPALPFERLPVFMQALRATAGPAARLLELIVLSAMRLNAVRPARFPEFDGAVWTIPAARMKALHRDHRIPLGPRAVEIVRELRDAAEGEFLFGDLHGNLIGKNRPGQVLSKLLQAIGHDAHAVPHGFRSAFKDWAHECRDYPREVVEMTLGHAIENRVEAAYRRSDLFARRAGLMLDWENYCNGVEADNMVKLRA